MSYWEVKDYLDELTEISAYEESEIISLCNSSLKEIEAKLKTDADKNDVRVIAAAAGLAYYKLALKQNSADDDLDITSFSAGDVNITKNSVSKEKMLEKAKEFYEKSLEDIIPMYQDNSFVFKQIG